jgi:hypothetical protein
LNAQPSRKITDQQLKILWGIGAVCAFRGCGQWLVQEASANDPAAVVGQMAHIVAHSDQGPRADPSYPPERRNLAENLILLCPTHHVLVDAQDSTYTVEELRGWKAAEERLVRETLGAKIRAVGFEELARATRSLLAAPAEALTDIEPPLKPREKLALNGLTAATEGTLNIGYCATTMSKRSSRAPRRSSRATGTPSRPDFGASTGSSPTRGLPATRCSSRSPTGAPKAIQPWRRRQPA